MLVEVYGHDGGSTKCNISHCEDTEKTLILHNIGRFINLSGFKQPILCIISTIIFSFLINTNVPGTYYLYSIS